MNVSRRAEKARKFFTPELAARYETRAGRVRRAEDRLLQQFVDLPAETLLLDVPVGTGRFLPWWESMGFRVIGIDASPAMLEHAAARVTRETTELRLGDIFALELADGSVDVTVAVRIMHLVEHDDFRAIVAELKRVTRRRIVMTLRLGDELHPCRGPDRARALTNVIGDTWRCTVDQVLVDDWHVVVLERGVAC